MCPTKSQVVLPSVLSKRMHPNRLDDGVVMYIPHEPPSYSALGIMRNASGGLYDAEDVAAMDKLAPHFRRAVTLQKQLLEINLQKRTALEALDLLPIGIVIADENAQVMFANRTAARLSREEGGIGLHGERIWAGDPQQTAEIRSKVHGAVLSAEAGKIVPGWSVALKRPAPRQPLSVTVSPLWGNHLRTSLGFLSHPYAILFISDPDSVQETHVELFQRLYGLTTAEAMVLKHLCEGLRPQEIADRLELAITTVRTHLSNLFSKTGTSRQSELLRLALASQPRAVF